MPDLGIFGLEFKKTIVIFEISTFGLVWLQNFVKKQKCLYLEPKMPFFGFIFLTQNALFGYLGQEFKKNYCHIWNQHPQMCLFAKFHQKKKTKMPTFGTKNAWFGYFWTGIWKQFCHIWNQHPRICLLAKFRGKTKMPKFGTKNALFGYFWPKMPCLDIFEI